MRSFPELLDIGIMGHCDACCAGVCRSAGVDCYQNAAVRRRSNMTAQAYSKLIQQCKGKAFQVALGGAGDPNKHEEFEEILKLTRENLLVPNLTTSGFALEDAFMIIHTYNEAYLLNLGITNQFSQFNQRRT